MDIMELGAIGELVGGVAVIGSLLYVGLQVRQSNEQATRANQIAQSESSRSVARDFNAIAMVLTDQDFGGVVRRGLTDYYALTKDEQWRLHTWLTSYALHLVAVWLEEDRGLLHDAFSGAQMGAFAAVAKTPGGAQWWNEVSPLFPPDFVHRIEQATARVPALTETLSWLSVDSPLPQGA